MFSNRQVDKQTDRQVDVRDQTSQQPIKVSKANVTLSVGKSERVNIQSGRFPYKAEAVDKSVVEVSVTDSTITIKA